MLPSRLRLADQGKERKGYREFHALHDISFDIRRGESWGIIGVNGSGKSTLLKIISGNLRPSTGRVEVDGKVAIIDYGSGFNGEFTGRENIYQKGSLLGLTKKQIDNRLKSIVEFADIDQFIDQPVKTYSSGMGARLGFAIMAHVDAEILITDEALAVGDAFFVQKCMRHIRSFLKRGTFLFVSHSTNDVMSLCDHAIWLEKGHVVAIGKANEICRAYLNSIDRQNSDEYLVDTQSSSGQAQELDEQVEPDKKDEKNPILEVRPSAKQIHISAETLAILKNHFLPPSKVDPSTSMRTSRVDVSESNSVIEDTLIADAAVGGGKIFSVTLTDEKNRAMPSILGGEVICLTVRAIAEKRLQHPIIGFQLLNNLGLSLVAENTFLVTRDQEIGLFPGEIVTARFRFSMPLVSVGEYVIRVGFADGVEDNNALVDVKHEALLLRCDTSGARHGIVGVPMLSIDVERDSPPLRMENRTGT